MRMLPRLAVLCLLFIASAATARPMTVDDLLSFEQWGQIAVDPSGRWLVVERRGPYADAPRFEAGYYSRYGVSRLHLVDLARAGPARPLMPQELGYGYVAGPVSPKGGRMLVYRFGHRRWEAGIVEIQSGEVRWLGLTPELAVFGRVAQWRSETELLLIARPPGDLPLHMRAGWKAMEQLPGRWALTANGATASVTTIGSGRFLGLRPQAPANRLMRIDAPSGSARLLASGGFFDLELSSSGRHVALATELHDLQPAAIATLRVGSALRRRNVVIVDLDTGRATSPCADCDVLTHLLAWSPKAEELLIFARRRPDEDWAQGRLVRIDAAAATAATVNTGDAVPTITSGQDGIGVVHADWLGDDPIVYARSTAQGDRSDWFRVSPSGPVNLTAHAPPPPAVPAAIDGSALMFIAGGRAWRVDRTGRAAELGRTENLSAVEPSQLDVGVRFTANSAPRRAWFAATGRLGDREGLWRISADKQVFLPIDAPRARVVALGPRDLVTATSDDHGGSTLMVRAAGRTDRPVLSLNQAYGDVDFAQVCAVPGRSPDGRLVTHWLYLPADWRPGRPAPLVVVPYPGATYPSPPAKYAAGASTFYTNPQVLAAHGYAVLVPSLPRAASGEPMAGLADQVLDAVDAVVAQGYADPDRVAVWGHSYGGYAALAVATQTSRFRSIIASAGISDLVAYWGSVTPDHAVNAEVGSSINWGAGWVEGGQARMGGPPWIDADRYHRNSPALAADRITSPVLLIHGDQDAVPLAQAQAMFTALYRQGKDAALVTFWGEGHVVASPGNVRDLYERVLGWLDVTMAPRRPTPLDAPEIGPPEPSQAARAAAPRPAPSSPPQRRE
ncbi:MAG: prolyl oligopeptidase family serine peptidase [Phenylobacterium sp.]|uniref:alpha/beta hydrolase family protein n=1 Tax=Phenylobacterium sp. TaxID=1871053 RepID=UPI0025D0E6E5|nr:alpha/beta fold hydrolase [Phenylobacterium sp.]MBI1198947.1 prolyl oligopeptidase family serine peptidase [Phenylobacterium sp.]